MQRNQRSSDQPTAANFKGYNDSLQMRPDVAINKTGNQICPYDHYFDRRQNEQRNVLN